MTTLNIPKFGELLAPHLSRIPDAARPGALARLERSAAERYRGWAEALRSTPKAYCCVLSAALRCVLGAAPLQLQGAVGQHRLSLR